MLPNSSDATTLARLATDEPTARRIIDLLAESFDPLAAVAGASEDGPGRWTVAIHFRELPNETAVRALVAVAAGADAADALAFETTAPKDWVRASLEGLTPVEAGRFEVHTAHYHAHAPHNRIAIEIEASLAFGTGHHGTTRGCLLALDRIVKRLGGQRFPLLHRRTSGKPQGYGSGALRRAVPQPSLPPCGGGKARGAGPYRTGGHRPPRKAGGSRPRLAHPQYPSVLTARPRTILDIGTGTGVLAIAAARALRRRVVASDIDPVAVRVARANVRLNRASAFVEVARADGLGARRLRGRYDLVFANILLGPLQRLATPIVRNVAPGGRVVLSGLLRAQASSAIASYRVHGLMLEQRIPLDGWVTLVLRRRGVAARRSAQ